MKIQGLQNRMRDFNNLARNSIGYRYTIPNGIAEQIQIVSELLGHRPRTGKLPSRWLGRSTRIMADLASAPAARFWVRGARQIMRARPDVRNSSLHHPVAASTVCRKRNTRCVRAHAIGIHSAQAAGTRRALCIDQLSSRAAETRIPRKLAPEKGACNVEPPSRPGQGGWARIRAS
jgi:hypothetical protein